MKKLTFIFLLVLASSSLSLLRPGSANAQECGGPVPPAPQKIWVAAGPLAGQITLHWDAAPHANRYAVAYGTASGKYLYGANNIGGENARSYTVKGLRPGVKYYFRLAAARDCSSSPYSSEVSAIARDGAVVPAPTALTVPITPTTPIAPTAPTAILRAPVVPPVTSGPVGKQRLVAVPGPAVGEVTLYWQHADSSDNYHLMYGGQPGKFQYGALNLGKVTRFTVGKLVPGRTYYFALVPIFNNQPLYTTAVVVATARSAAQVVQTTPEALITPQPRQPVVEAPPPSELLTPPAGGATESTQPTTPAGL